MTRRVFLLFLFSAVLAVQAAAQSTPATIPGVTRSAAAEMLRHEYFLGDATSAGERGKGLLAEHPSDLELEAWYVISAGKVTGNDDILSTTGLDAVVDRMKEEVPDSAWTLLAEAVIAPRQRVVKVGASISLVEEFSWRIDAMRGKTEPAPTPYTQPTALGLQAPLSSLVAGNQTTQTVERSHAPVLSGELRAQ
jgi:hypothetical protein